MPCIMRHRAKFQKRSVYFGLMRVLKGPLVCQQVSSFCQRETETCTNPRQGNEQRHDTLPCRAPNRIQIFPSPAFFCSFMLETARCVALCSNRRRFLIYVPVLISQQDMREYLVALYHGLQSKTPNNTISHAQMKKTNKVSGGENLEHDNRSVDCLTMIQVVSLVLQHLTNVSGCFYKIHANSI